MPEASAAPRRCVRCDAELPADRSVCPVCGTLQPAGRGAVTTRPRTIGAMPVEPPNEPGVGEFPGLPPTRGERRGPLAVPPRRAPTPAPAEPAPAPAAEPAAMPPETSAPEPSVEPATEAPAADPPGARPMAASASTTALGPPPDLPPVPAADEDPWDDEPRRRTATTLVVIAIVAVLAIGAVAVLSSRRDDGGPARRSVAPQVDAVRAFCDDPAPLGEDVPAFDPAKAAIAYVEHPAPPSSTEPDDELVLQVAPTIGEPVLTLEASVELVNVALCLERGATSDVGGTCRFELTNPSDLGEEVERPLRRTSYEATLYELRTGDALASGPISTPTEACPQFAFTDRTGVVAPLTDAQLVAWLTAKVPTGT